MWKSDTEREIKSQSSFLHKQDLVESQEWNYRETLSSERRTDFDLARLPRVWIVLEMRVRVREVAGSWGRHKWLTLSHHYSCEEKLWISAWISHSVRVHTVCGGVGFNSLDGAAVDGTNWGRGWQERRNAGKWNCSLLCIGHPGQLYKKQMNEKHAFIMWNTVYLLTWHPTHTVSWMKTRSGCYRKESVGQTLAGKIHL